VGAQAEVDVSKHVTTGSPFVPAVATGVKQVIWLPPVATHCNAAKVALLQAHSEAQATSWAIHVPSKHPHRAPASIVAALAAIGVQVAAASALVVLPPLPVLPPLAVLPPLPGLPPLPAVLASLPPLELEPHPPSTIAANGMTSEIPKRVVDERM
jgi:hypothetical protein